MNVNGKNSLIQKLTIGNIMRSLDSFIIDSILTTTWTITKLRICRRGVFFIASMI